MNGGCRRDLGVRPGTGGWRRWAAAAALAVALAACGSNLPEEQQVVNDAVRTNFATWKPVTARDLGAEEARRWSQEHKGQSPGMTAGDYFGDRAKSYAVLLTKQAKEGRRVRVVVMKPTPSGRFESFVVYTESPVDTVPRITTGRAGEYQVFVGGQSLTVPTEGIVYTRGDGRQKLFFWNVDHFQDVELTP